VQRLRLVDLRVNSRFPAAVGLCASDYANLALMANSAEQRLLKAREAGDEGWYGTFAEMIFTASRCAPYITLPRQVARLEAVDVCGEPVPVHNQFFEYLRFGNGRLPKMWLAEGHRQMAAYSRNNVASFLDLFQPPQYIAVYCSNPADDGQRLLVQGTDSTGDDIYTMDGGFRVKGAFVTTASPFAIVADNSGNPLPFYSITGYQKGGTIGTVQFFQVNPTTGQQVLLSTMEPNETTAWYRRYYFHSLPFDCCRRGFQSPCIPELPPEKVQISAIVKLDPVPVRFDTDYLLLQCAEAFIEEAQSIRYSTMDTTAAKQFSAQHHRNAIGFLNGELAHYYGKNEPAVNFAPFGNARLERQKIGCLI